MSCIGSFQSLAPSSSSSSPPCFKKPFSDLSAPRFHHFPTSPLLTRTQFTSNLAHYRFLSIGPRSRSRGSIGSFQCFAALTPELKTTLEKVVTSNKVILFMKGTKDFPQCGFSNTVVHILKSMNVPVETINILEDEILRQGLEYSSWPTFPQLYIDGEFFGGGDLTVEVYKNGELQEILEKAMCS